MKPYFPNLDGIRCIAASSVVVHHLEQFRSLYGLSNWWTVPVVQLMGKLGVILFFVLSGFLITYLLLAEEKTQGSINIHQFYIRRILRIWPLYFAVVLAALFLIPRFNILLLPGYTQNAVQEHMALKLVLYFTFFANLVNQLVGIVPYASQAWSVGTEEQFYLVWPVALKFIGKRYLLIIAVIAVYPIVGLFLKAETANPLSGMAFLKAFWSGFNIDHMCIGALFALLLFHRHKILPLLVNKWAFSSAVLLVGTMLLLGRSFPVLHLKGYSLCFGLIILNMAANSGLSHALEQKPTKFLGRISYGLYMLHPLCIVSVLLLCLAAGIQTRWVMYPLALIATVVLSYLSFRFFESPFLRLKRTFSPLEVDAKDHSISQKKSGLEETFSSNLPLRV